LADIVEQVLEKEMVVLKKTGYGETALHAVACRGNSDIIRLLLKAGA